MNKLRGGAGINKRKNSNKVYTCNSLLYFLLVAVFALVSGLLILFLYLFFENEKANVICSALLGIMGGSLASVIVAWLLDFSECKRKNKEVENRILKSLKYLDDFLDILFQGFANAAQEELSLTWKEWLKKLYEKDFYRSADNFYNRFLEIYVALNEIIQQIDELNSIEVKDFMLKKDSSFLSELSLLSTACKTLRDIIFLQKEDGFEFMIFEFEDVFSTILRFCSFKEKRYKFQVDSNKK